MRHSVVATANTNCKQHYSMLQSMPSYYAKM